ncbi:MAG: selenocysteine-specific translation elongation factor [Gemmataceae bacterium]
MLRNLILGTAGHIDHGKTSLVKALTGVDCDRLPEERTRKITIDIGFATLMLGDYQLGIVDVPGHERFVKNMLAGATGLDLAMLVVAADDSVMPQTREHLEILQLLGLRHGLIALTKADVVDETSLEVAELEVRELVEGTFLEEAPIVPTSAHTGAGISELKERIGEVCQRVKQRTDEEWFRIAIDRSFVVQGHGTIVTGSVTSGKLKVGDEVEWQPRGEMVRVRSLQNHDNAVEEVHRGQRAAINLAGVHHEDVVRGQELATPGYLKPSRVLTIRLHCLKTNKKPIKHRASVRLHVGTAEVLGVVSLLESDTVQPGEWGLAQVFLEQPTTGVWGQPFVLRDPSATITLGGGQILQSGGKKIRRRHLELQEKIERLWESDDETRALTVAWFAGFSGLTSNDLVREANVSPGRVKALVTTLKDRGDICELALGGTKTTLLHRETLDQLEDRVTTLLANLHEQFPLMTYQDRQRVQSQLDYVGDEQLVHTVVSRMIEEKKLVGNLKRIALADHKPQLSNNQRKLKAKMIESYKAAGFQPPDPSEFNDMPGSNPKVITDLYEVLVAEGFLVHVTDDIYLDTDSDNTMREKVSEAMADGNGLTVAEIRDLLGTTRKFAVPICEYLDQVGLTRREGDLRYLNEAVAKVS